MVQIVTANGNLIVSSSKPNTSELLTSLRKMVTTETAAYKSVNIDLLWLGYAQMATFMKTLMLIITDTLKLSIQTGGDFTEWDGINIAPLIFLCPSLRFIRIDVGDLHLPLKLIFDTLARTIKNRRVIDIRGYSVAKHDNLVITSIESLIDEWWEFGIDNFEMTIRLRHYYPLLADEILTWPCRKYKFHVQSPKPSCFKGYYRRSKLAYREGDWVRINLCIKFLPYYKELDGFHDNV